MPKYLPAAKKCIERIDQGKPAKLEPADRAAMIRELTAAGVKFDVKHGDAYVAVRYDAEFNEGDHPRGEGGRFGAGAASAKAESTAHTAFHKELALNSGKSGAPSHKEVGAAFRESQAAYKQAAEAHQAEGNKNLAGFHESKSAEQGRVAESHEAAANKPPAIPTRPLPELVRASNGSGDWVEKSTPNPADKLTPGMKAAGATMYAKAMSKEAKKSGTPEAHLAASNAHAAAAERHRAMGSETAAKGHDKKAVQEKITATLKAAPKTETPAAPKPAVNSNVTGWRENLGKSAAESKSLTGKEEQQKSGLEHRAAKERDRARAASVKANDTTRKMGGAGSPAEHDKAATFHREAQRAQTLAAKAAEHAGQRNSSAANYAEGHAVKASEHEHAASALRSAGRR